MFSPRVHGMAPTNPDSNVPLAPPLRRPGPTAGRDGGGCCQDAPSTEEESAHIFEDNRNQMVDALSEHAMSRGSHVDTLTSQRPPIPARRTGADRQAYGGSTT